MLQHVATVLFFFSEHSETSDFFSRDIPCHSVILCPQRRMSRRRILRRLRRRCGCAHAVPTASQGDCTEGLTWTSLKQFETFAKKDWTAKFQLSQRMAEKSQSSCCLRILDAIHGFGMGIVWYCQLISWALVLAKGDFQVMIAAIQVLCPVLLGRSMEEAWNGKWQHVRFWSQTWSHLEWPRDTWSLHEFFVQCWFYVILQNLALKKFQKDMV